MTIFTRQSLDHATILLLVILFASVCDTLSLSLSLSLSPIRSDYSIITSPLLSQATGPIKNSSIGYCYQGRRRRRYTPLLMTTDNSNNNDTDDKESTSSSNNVPFFEDPNVQARKVMSNGGNKKKKSTSTSVLFTVPLFFKFIAVLCIKFLTDAVVFPSLFLYRLLRRIKRKTISFFRQDGSIKPNGETSSD